MLQNQFQTKTLQQIIYYIPNFVTGSRYIFNYAAAYLFQSSPQVAGLLIMISVLLDYVDGMVARKYNQCTFFGDIFDWITDISTYVVVLFWWNQVEPQFLLLFFTLFCLEIVMMITDIVSKCCGFLPKLTTDKWSTCILKYTMNVEVRGYTCVGVGYYNLIFHFLCIVSRAIYLQTQCDMWHYIFIACLPFSVSYVWMHFGYTVNILQKWNEEYQDSEIKVKFVEH